MRFSTTIRASALVVFAAVIAACSSSSGVSNPPVVVVPSGPPLQSSGTVSSSTSSTAALPTIGTSGYVVGGTLPTANAVATITESTSASAPTGVTPLSVARRSTLSSSGNTDLLYVTFSSATAVTLSTVPALSFTSSSIASGTSYYLGMYTSTGWQAPLGAAATVSGTTASFPATAPTVTIAAGGSVTFVLYTGPGTPTPVASPNALNFDVTAPGTVSTFGISEAGYNGAFTGAIACTENPASQSPASDAYVAEFTGASQTPSETQTAGVATFSVTSGAETGTCTATISDANKGTTTVTITVTGTGLVVY